MSFHGSQSREPSLTNTSTVSSSYHQVVASSTVEPLVSMTVPSHSTTTPTGRQSEPQIRHAGRAHIRGKIRRIWRPRFLELFDNGLVRYYELPASADIALQVSSDWDHVNMIPKYTLAIFQARILDVTTLRDMHVGLPRGTFGFVFRGQRLVHLEEEYAAHIQQQCGGQDVVKEQRDFLCAVTSLEEAQMWVVALQWAASQQMPLFSGPLSMIEAWWNEDGTTPRTRPNHNNPLQLKNSWEDDMLGVQVLDGAQLEGVSRNPPPKARDSHHETTTTPPKATDTVQRRESSPYRPPPARSGKVAVSKVAQYRIVRLSLWQFEIAYEIHGMLLRHQKAEQWSMLRTADDFSRLLSELNQELGPTFDQAPYIQQLPRLAQRPSQEQVQSSLSVVDSLLRSLVMDASTVNAVSLKAFLGLASFSPIRRLGMRWWTIHHAQSVISRKTVLLHQTMPTEQFVKQWLQKYSSVQQSVIDAQAIVLFQRPLLLWGGLGLSCGLVVLPLTRQCVPSISVRLDYLLFSWVGAAYIGSLYPMLLSGTTSASVATSRPTRERPPLSPTKPSPHKLSTIPASPSASNDTDILPDDNIDDDFEESDGEEMVHEVGIRNDDSYLSSPLPKFPANEGHSCWSQPDANIFHVRGINYLNDKVKIPSGPAPLTCRGVDVWMTDTPERHIARHPSVLGGKLGQEDTFLVNFLLPFGNLVAYFSIPPLSRFPKKLKTVWTKFLRGDQEYRDARLKLLPVVAEGPWIVKAAVGPGKSPALLGKVIPLQYFFREPGHNKKGIYEVDVIITASSIAKGILSVVKGHTKSVSIAFAFIIEGAQQEELPETVLCCFQLHTLHLEHCPMLPACNLDFIQ